MKTCFRFFAVVMTAGMSFVSAAKSNVVRIEDGTSFVELTEKAISRNVECDGFFFRVRSSDDKKAFAEAVSLIRNRQPDMPIMAVYPREDGSWKELLSKLIIATYCDAPEYENAFIDHVASVRMGIDYDSPQYKALLEKPRRRTQRLHDAKWGVFNHYLGGDSITAAEWNARVDAFDVKALGERLSACGAGFYFITVMQGTRWMLAPNATYDRICGTKPGEACSRRDLVMEIADELNSRGIDFYLYYTGDGPYRDRVLGPRMGLVAPRYSGVDRAFVERWSSVLEEYAVRYGKKVKGWWIDGCYKDFLKYNDDLLDMYAAAIRKGDPDAVVAFNNGVREYYTAYGRSADFTAGEFNDFYAVPKERFVGGQQAFALIPLGAWKSGGNGSGWCGKGMKITTEKLVDYVKRVNERGGVVAIDIRINPDSSWEQEHFEALKALKNVRDRTSAVALAANAEDETTKVLKIGSPEGNVCEQIASLPVACREVVTVEGREPSLLPRGKMFKLVWHDEFDGNALDESKWSYRTNFWGRRAHWFAAPEDGCVEVRDGKVHLKLKRLANGQFVSPQLQTGELLWDIPHVANPSGFWSIPKRKRPRFVHRYGYYECRCRLQRMPGWWSAFWMQSEAQGTTLDPGISGIEHDIMESFDPGEVIVAAFHMNGYGPDYRGFHIPHAYDEEPKFEGKLNLAVDTESFHTFGLLWEPDGYSVFVDGRFRGRNGTAVSHIPEFILLTTEAKWYRNNRMTGKGVPELSAAAQAGDDFVVDYVRVYDVEE